MTAGRVAFVGGGPGAADLLTLRAARTLARADVIVWSRRLLAREAIDEHVGPDAEVIVWPPATMEDVLGAYDRARDEGLLVARLCSGDPALFGRLGDELEAARERGLEIELVPGVSAVFAAAAALRCELADGAERANLVLADNAGGAEEVTVLFGAGAGAQRALEERGHPPATPCAVAHRVSWPDELLAVCRLDELDKRLGDLGLDRLTLVVAGPGLRFEGGG